MFSLDRLGVQIEPGDTPIRWGETFKPLLKPARYKAAFGGRGSGKSHFFATLMVYDSMEEPELTGEGLRSVCIRELQKDLKESAKLLIEDKLKEFGLGEADGFRIYKDRIETPGDGVIIFKGMQDYSAESIKSLERFKRAWIEEAQTLSERSLTMLRPTIRAPGSQIWASWNPRRKADPIDQFLRQQKFDPGEVIIVKANWRDNPWFGETLQKERELDLKLYPDRYEHIWEGDYAKAFEGSYFGKQLVEARAQGRIGRVSADPLLPIKTFWDLGGAGQKGDATAIWVAQFVGREIRLLDYIEGVGQVLGYYLHELRRKGYAEAECILPHDGANANQITGKRYVDHIRDAGFEAPEPVGNLGAGTAMLRVEAVRRLLPRCWFNEKT